MELGMKVEEYARGKGHLRNVFVTNALLEMYAKCGSIQRAWQILVRLWALQGILKESHSLFAMFHGPIGTSLDRQPSADFARGHLHTFVTVLNSSESHFTAI
ncbi:hypothetical protein ZWY2020_059330 [Hordeum vulgare]|nr:hypothetical protein ZWY2020_059330 [Hordeum vulgare]